MNWRKFTCVTCTLAALTFVAACQPRQDAPPGNPGDIVLRRGNGDAPQTLDPALAEDVQSFAVLSDLYEGLLSMNASGDLVSGVARSWELSADGRTYTFRLRRDARWSNGQQVTAQQFVDGFRRTLDPATGSNYSFLLSPIEQAGAIARGEVPPSALGATARDEYTLVVRLESPTPYFLSILAMPIAFPLFDVESSHIRRFSTPSEFVGNGPFVLENWQPGHPIRLRRNSEFHSAQEVAVDVVEYFPVSDPFSELNMFRAGELEITATVPTASMSELREAHASELHVAPSLGVYYIAFDTGETPLASPQLRQALSMAIDREALVAVIGRGEQPAYGLVPDGVAGYAPARFDWHELGRDERQDHARQLYAMAGYSESRPLELTLLYDAGDIHETVALAVRSMWQEVLGANIQLDKREWKYFLETRENRDDWQAMRFAWTGDYNHPSTFTDLFRSKSPQNLPGYTNPDYDVLSLEAASVNDVAEQMRLLASAEKRLLADNPIAPLYFYVSKHLVSLSISGYRDNVMDLHPSRYMSVTPQDDAH